MVASGPSEIEGVIFFLGYMSKNFLKIFPKLLCRWNFFWLFPMLPAKIFFRRFLTKFHYFQKFYFSKKPKNFFRKKSQKFFKNFSKISVVVKFFLTFPDANIQKICHGWKWASRSESQNLEYQHREKSEKISPPQKFRKIF